MILDSWFLRVTATTGNNTSYSVIVDPGTGKRILILPIVNLLNSGITTNSSEKLFQNELNGKHGLILISHKKRGII